MSDFINITNKKTNLIFHVADKIIQQSLAHAATIDMQEKKKKRETSQCSKNNKSYKNFQEGLLYIICKKEVEQTSIGKRSQRNRERKGTQME